MFDTLRDARRLATMRDADGYGIVDDAALGIRDGEIAWSRAARDLPRDATARKTIDAVRAGRRRASSIATRIVVYAGNRANEFEQRPRGASYADIARGGGGIRSTVEATRAASRDALAAAARRGRRQWRRRAHHRRDQVRYGSTRPNELKQLRVARRSASRWTSTYARRCSPRMRCRRVHGRADDYVGLRVRETIPAAAREASCDAVDAFCETIGSPRANAARVRAARAHGLPVKLHADQLSDGDGARSPRNSARCRRIISNTRTTPASRRWRAPERSPCCCPALLCAARNAVPPIAALRAHGVPIAISTDCNPGTSPATSLPLMMNMACTLFG
jgi:imidazolonepropionase